MNNTNLIRKLVNEFLLNEIEEKQLNLFNDITDVDIESKYQNWVNDFKNKILNSDIKETILRNILLKVPNSYKIYKNINWLYKDYVISGRNGTFTRKPIQIINFFSGKQHDIGNRIPSVVIRSLTDFEHFENTSLDKQENPFSLKKEITFDISKVVKNAKSTDFLDLNEIKESLLKGSNGEYLVASILGDKTGESVTSKNALWDITINGMKFEVKDATRGSFWAGKTGRDNAKSFIKEISIALNEFDKFKQRVEGSQLFELSDAKNIIQQIDQNTLNSFKNGEIKDLNIIKNIFLEIRNLKIKYISSLKNQNEENNFSVQFSTLDKPIAIPQDKKDLYYLTINYLEKNLFLDSNSILKQEEKKDYIKSIFSILKNELFNFSDINPIDEKIELLKDPNKNFNNEITGIFILKDISTNDPKINYFPRASIKNYLKFERISKFTTKFNI